MIDNENKDTFSIRHIAAETGVNPVTLRAWERRYGLIKPMRTPKGHRLYTEQDVFLVKNILFILSQGYAISKVKELLKNEHIQMIEPGNYQSLVPRFKAIAEALTKFNHIHLETEVKALFTLYSPEQFGDEILPRMFRYLEANHYSDTSLAFSHKSFLFDLLQAMLYQFLYQNIHSNTKTEYILVGYRTAMIQTRLLHGLLLANVIKAYEHKVDFVSGLSSIEEIIEIGNRFQNKQVVVFTSADSFILGQLIAKFERNEVSNILIHTQKRGADQSIIHENHFLLHTKYSNLYGALINHSKARD